MTKKKMIKENIFRIYLTDYYLYQIQVELVHVLVISNMELNISIK